ncbi:MAG: hypothetical protein KAT05_10660, partial [Spirochaetes bacterium]|nr:hypothetical protein [Spirochaetota bacterium]
AGGVPAWYLSAIGLGYITEHPGIVSVRPIDGNMGWLYLGYYGGISLIAVGSVLIAAGIALILVGLLTHGSRVKVFYKTDIKTASASMGLSFAL